jgi:hypothetical protein
MTELLPLMEDTGDTIGSVFHYVGVLEEELHAGYKRYPESRSAIFELFMPASAYGEFLALNDSVYRAHVREMVDYAGETGKLLKFSTDAEIMVGIKAASHKTPLKDAVGLVYWRIFKEVYPDAEILDDPLFSESNLKAMELIHGQEADEIYQLTKRKKVR